MDSEERLRNVEDDIRDFNLQLDALQAKVDDIKRRIVDLEAQEVERERTRLALGKEA